MGTVPDCPEIDDRDLVYRAQLVGDVTRALKAEPAFEGEGEGGRRRIACHLLWLRYVHADRIHAERRARVVYRRRRWGFGSVPPIAEPGSWGF